MKELEALHEKPESSRLYENLMHSYGDDKEGERYLSSIRPGHIAEKAIAYLFCEQNMIGESLLVRVATDLSLDTDYLEKVLYENRHPVSFSQHYLL